MIIACFCVALKDSVVQAQTSMSTSTAEKDTEVSSDKNDSNVSTGSLLSVSASGADSDDNVLDETLVDNVEGGSVLKASVRNSLVNGYHGPDKSGTNSKESRSNSII